MITDFTSPNHSGGTALRLRFSLRSMLVLVLIAAALLARYSYVQNQHAALQKAGARVLYDWEQPSLMQQEIFITRTVNESPHEEWFILRSLSTSPLERSWLGILNSSFIGDEVDMIVFDPKSCDSSAIIQAKNLPSVRHIFLENASTVPSPAPSEFAKLVDSLESKFPSASVHAYVERKTEE